VGWVVAVAAVLIAAGLAVQLQRAQRELADARVQGSEHDLHLEELERELTAAKNKLAEPPPAPVPAPTMLDGDGTALVDPTTGLFNEAFFRVTLNSRVSAARRHLRPVAVVLLQVAGGVKEGAATLTEPAVVASAIHATLRDADTACRLRDGRYAFVLEDTPENGAVWTVERVRRALATDHPGQTLWAGIACYPAHAFDADELLDRAGQALTAAQEWHQDRIEVATADA
jgi:two-component system cell cycle response regulator